MAVDGTDGATLEGQVRTFLQRNFPQIQLHGGDATVERADADAGAVSIRLSGACSGCGISPMTIQAIQSRLPGEVDAIDEVTVETGPPEDPGDDAGGEEDDHHGMGGHPAGGGVNADFQGEIPEWRRED